MHTLWPFGRDDSSPASYERALSRLAAQITSSTISLEKARSRAHRSKSFWTLWSTLAYLIYTSILVLVLGPQQWSPPHYAGLAGSPIFIYVVRRSVAFVFEWQMSRRQARLSRLVKERDQKIDQLKKATKYDSTQELLNKYGGNVAPKPDGSDRQVKKNKKIMAPSNSGNVQDQQFQRTGFGPPPTANIPGRSPPTGKMTGSRPAIEESRGPSQNKTPSYDQTRTRPSQSSTMSYPSPHSDLSPDEPGFAPNAFPIPPLSRASSSTQNWEPQSRWYDRILDVMLGEDETLAKNRLALICTNCRMVNGQAPPGVHTLEEVGRWRCGSCSAWNGAEEAEHEAERMVRETTRQGQQRRVKDPNANPDQGPRGYHVRQPQLPILDDGRDVEEDAEDSADSSIRQSSRSPSPPRSSATREIADSAGEDSETDLDGRLQGTGENGKETQRKGEASNNTGGEDDSVAKRIAKSKRHGTSRSARK